ncbi:MAG: hypothetical protein JOY90_13870 [Bradyrhizobium sp.]|uniref:hypothetical protein n=1 Tax=Bradyrhizobium sp. TaxID=376 RepID=UPI001D675DC0|nr:hypothetical protein [Bradyrhizobium sp.]MBV9561516.1 hypothetical protein [Bradyrhizobium sp.]
MKQNSEFIFINIDRITHAMAHSRAVWKWSQLFDPQSISLDGSFIVQRGNTVILRSFAMYLRASMATDARNQSLTGRSKACISCLAAPQHNPYWQRDYCSIFISMIQLG